MPKTTGGNTNIASLHGCNLLGQRRSSCRGANFFQTSGYIEDAFICRQCVMLHKICFQEAISYLNLASRPII